LEELSRSDVSEEASSEKDARTTVKKTGGYNDQIKNPTGIDLHPELHRNSIDVKPS